jgi:hypothetical protein
VQRPALDAAAGHVARPEHDVGAVPGRVDQPREVGGIVGEVGVHLDHEVGAGRQRLAESGEVGAAEAVLALAMQDADVGVLEREPVGEVAGAVRRRVVHDEHGARDGRVAARERGPRERDHGREVLALVVGGEDDPGGGHGEELLTW